VISPADPADDPNKVSGTRADVKERLAAKAERLRICHKRAQGTQREISNSLAAGSIKNQKSKIFSETKSPSIPLGLGQ